MCFDCRENRWTQIEGNFTCELTKLQHVQKYIIYMYTWYDMRAVDSKSTTCEVTKQENNSNGYKICKLMMER